MLTKKVKNPSKVLKKKIKPAFNAGFSLIELIVDITGLAILRSISSTVLQNIFSDPENDEVQANLNSLAAEFLKIHANITESKNAIAAPTAIDCNLIDKSTPVDVSVEYKEKSGNTCKYFQINSKDSTSKTHLSIGFEIAHSKIIKFAIKDLPIQGLQLL